MSEHSNIGRFGETFKLEDYDPQKVIAALRCGHPILGPTERELVAAAMLERLLSNATAPNAEEL